MIDEEKSSSWNLDQLQHENEDSDPSVDFFTSLEKSVAKHVYFGRRNDDDHDEEEDETNSECKIIERTTPATIRVDSSDLITRCRDFLPRFTDANRALVDKLQSGENVRIELDSDHEEKTGDSRAIEMNLMFCPDNGSSSAASEKSEKESGEASTTDDDDENPSAMKTLTTIAKKKRKKKKKKNRKKTKIVEIEKPLVEEN